MTATANLRYAAQPRFDDKERGYEVLYIVTTTTEQDGPKTIRDALPALGSTYATPGETDTAATAISYRGIKPISWGEGSRMTWEATVVYSTEISAGEKNRTPSPPEEDPLNEPAIISVGGYNARKEADEEAATGRKILNSVGDPFPHGIQVDDSQLSLRITKNFASINMSGIASFMDTVNKFPFFGQAPRTWKMDPAKVQLNYKGDKPYYSVQYEFRSRLPDWDLRPIDEGTRDKDGKPFVDVNGVQVHGVFPLDGVGNSPGGPGVFLDTALAIKNGNPTVIRFGDGPFHGGHDLSQFKYYAEKNFAQLGIPTQLP